MKWLDALLGRSDVIVVEDERTYRAATRKIVALMASGSPRDLSRAHSGLVATRCWLRYELDTGPQADRVIVMRRLELSRVRLAEIHTALGLPPPARMP